MLHRFSTDYSQVMVCAVKFFLGADDEQEDSSDSEDEVLCVMCQIDSFLVAACWFPCN